MNAVALVEICNNLGLRIEPCENRLLVVDTQHEPPYVPEHLFRLLVEHRDEIRDRLCAAHLCKAVLLGEFSGSDRNIVAQIIVELQRHLPTCPARDAALARLEREGRP
jgi:hypothetical protein